MKWIEIQSGSSRNEKIIGLISVYTDETNRIKKQKPYLYKKEFLSC